MTEKRSLYPMSSLKRLFGVIAMIWFIVSGCEPKIDGVFDTSADTPTLTIMGRVMEESAEGNKPLAGATVYTGTHSTTTDANGNYEFSKIPITAFGHTYTLRAKLSGYALRTTQTVSDTTTADGTDESENIGNRTAIASDLILTPLDATLQGYVYLPPTVTSAGAVTSNPASSVTVQIQAAGAIDPETLPTRSVTTDSTGKYSFEVADSAAADTYTLFVPSFTRSSVTYANATSSAWTVSSQGTVAGPTIMLQNIKESLGHVVWTNLDRDGDPDNAEVNQFDINNDIVVVFSEAMDTTGDDFGGVEATLTRTGVPAAIAVSASWDSTSTILTLNPDKDLQYSAAYTLTIRGYSQDGDFVRYENGAGTSTGEEFAFSTESMPSVAGWVGPVQSLSVSVAGAQIPLDWDDGTAGSTFTLSFNRPANHTDDSATTVNEGTDEYLLDHLQGYRVYAKKVMPTYLTDATQDGDSAVEAIANSVIDGEWVELTGAVQVDTGAEPMSVSVALSAGDFNVLDSLDMLTDDAADDNNYFTLGTEIFLAVASVNADGITDPEDQWAVYSTSVRDQDPPTITSIQVSDFDNKKVTIRVSEPLKEADAEGATYTFVNDNDGGTGASDDLETDPTVSSVVYQLRDTDNDGFYERSEIVLTMSDVTVIDNGDWIRISGTTLPTDNRNSITENTGATLDTTFGDNVFTSSNIGPRITGVSLDAAAETVSITFSESVNVASIGTLTFTYRGVSYTSTTTSTATNGATIVYTTFAGLNITTAAEAGDTVSFASGFGPRDASDNIQMGTTGNSAVYNGTAWVVY